MGSEEESISLKILISVPECLQRNHVLPQLLVSPTIPYISLPREKDKSSAAIIEFISSLPDCRYQIPYFYLQKVNFNVGISFLIYLTPATIDEAPACCSLWIHRCTFATMSARACLPYARLPIDNLMICPIVATNRSRLSSCPPDNVPSG